MSKNSGILNIIDILNEYSYEIQDGIKEEAIRVTKEGVKTLKQTSPKDKRNTRRKGKYAKGWTVKTEKGMNYVHTIIHNKTDYQLTHLLENGHKLLDRNGHQVGYVKPQPHIKAVEEEVVRNYEKAVEDVIRNGGK